MSELFKIIYDRLVAQMTVNIFDHVPQDTIGFPYVRIDPIEANNNDVDDKNGFTATVNIIGFSRYRGSKEVSDLNNDIYNALHHWDFPDTTNFSVSTINQDFSSIVTENDGLTRQSIQRFNLVFEPLGE